MTAESASALKDLPPPELIERLILARWLVLGLLTVAALLAGPVLALGIPVKPVLACLGMLAVINGVVGWDLRARHFALSQSGLLLQLIVDLAGLGLLMYMAGGAANPLISLLLPVVAIGAIALPTPMAILLTGLSIAEYFSLLTWSIPMEMSDARQATQLHLLGMGVVFAVSVTILVWLIQRMRTLVSERNAQLVIVREQALRRERIVALGIQASGAAHELSTPLATLAVIAGELARDPNLSKDLRDDIDVIREQVGACRTIITRMTERAGVQREDELLATTATKWIRQSVLDWQASWANVPVEVAEHGEGEEPQLIVGTSLKQALLNLLDNSARASGGRPIDIVVSWNEATLDIAFQDQGPGFPAHILAQRGSAMVKSEGGGAGMGLFIARAAVEQMGGSFDLGNLPGRGAWVRWRFRQRRGA